MPKAGDRVAVAGATYRVAYLVSFPLPGVVLTPAAAPGPYRHVPVDAWTQAARPTGRGTWAMAALPHPNGQPSEDRAA